MSGSRYSFALAVSALLAACQPQAGINAGTSTTNPADTPEAASAAPSSRPADTVTTAAILQGAPLDWERDHPERAAWSASLRQGFAAEMSRLGEPADMPDYCPSYSQLDDEARTEVWATLAVAIARRESAYKPGTVFSEPPPLNVDSIGLFQLSYEDGFSWCDLNRETESLKDPLVNIDCAVGEMARLVAKDGVIASGSKGSDAKGLSRYWSVVREGSGHHKAEIRDRVRAMEICAG